MEDAKDGTPSLRRQSRLRRLMFYSFLDQCTLPPDASVDPGKFSEVEFPIFCPNCNYRLQGLSENRCPECGREFDRGRLLVQQYVVERGKRTQVRLYKILVRIWIVFIVFALVPGVVSFLLRPGNGWTPRFISDKEFAIIAMISSSLMFFPVIVGAILLIVGFLRNASKCRKVVDVIKEQDAKLSKSGSVAVTIK